MAQCPIGSKRGMIGNSCCVASSGGRRLRGAQDALFRELHRNPRAWNAPFSPLSAPYTASAALEESARQHPLLDSHQVTKASASDAVRALSWWLIAAAAYARQDLDDHPEQLADELVPLSPTLRGQLLADGMPAVDVLMWRTFSVATETDLTRLGGLGTGGPAWTYLLGMGVKDLLEGRATRRPCHELRPETVGQAQLRPHARDCERVSTNGRER
jgi:hypothetical protein